MISLLCLYFFQSDGPPYLQLLSIFYYHHIITITLFMMSIALSPGHWPYYHDLHQDNYLYLIIQYILWFTNPVPNSMPVNSFISGNENLFQCNCLLTFCHNPGLRVRNTSRTYSPSLPLSAIMSVQSFRGTGRVNPHHKNIGQNIVMPKKLYLDEAIPRSTKPQVTAKVPANHLLARQAGKKATTGMATALTAI